MKDKALLQETALIEAMGAGGFTDEQIAIALELKPSTWTKKKAKYPALRDAMEKGKIRYLGGAITKGQRWVPDMDRIEELAAAGLIEKQIAAQCGISEKQFRDRKIDFPEIDIRIQRGRGKTALEFSAALKENAIQNKNVVAQIFGTKVFAEWNDQPHKVQHEHNGEVNVNSTHYFVAPEMLESDDFQAMIERQKAKAAPPKAIASDATAEDDSVDTIDAEIRE